MAEQTPTVEDTPYVQPDFPLTYTFGDLYLQTGYTDFDKDEIRLGGWLTRNIELDMPVAAAPMDTVVNAEFALILSRLGGFAFTHRYLSVEDQAKQVEWVVTHGGRVGGAVDTMPGYMDRVDALVDAGVAALAIDLAHGNIKYELDAIATIKRRHSGLDVVGGNIDSADGARRLIDAGADATKVGMGPGAICTTRVVTGIGKGQLSAIMEVDHVARQRGIPVIGDGGIVRPGDVMKAIGAGASSVMMGRVFAATTESAAERVYLNQEEAPPAFKHIFDGEEEHGSSRPFKPYRGMGSKAALRAAREAGVIAGHHGEDTDTDDWTVAEGVDGLIPETGSVNKLVAKIANAMVRSYHDIGCINMDALHARPLVNRFNRVTANGMMEADPHDLAVASSDQNYYL